MLSPATLNRVSHSYRRGYYDGYEWRANQNLPVPKTEAGIPLKPFSDFDYSEGFKAGENDRKWADRRANMATIVQSRTTTRDESPSYRAAMIDAGRGRLLR